MARQHNYRYEYKKQHFEQKPDYTTDILLKVYVRYSQTNIQHVLHFEEIHEQYISSESNYVIGSIRLSELIAKREKLRAPYLFLANLPIFFLNSDN